MTPGDTIAAVATAPGRGGVAIVRVSGPDALAVGRRLTGREPEAGRASFRRICDGATPSAVLDEGLVLAFRAPRSYTGEDVVEFHCHGGTVTPRRILEACLAAGARLARRGEFTERAFLNGKLNYDQAESVLDLVDAKTARAADAALDGLAGRRRRELQALYAAALDLSTRLEHALDVDEAELPPDFAAAAAADAARIESDLASALRRVREGKILRMGARVVLAGPPNAGKSSLMNALLGEGRAIVSDVPGTTRDSIEEWLDLDGWPVRLVDTAGLRDAADAIEAEGVRRAEELVERADVVLGLRTGDWQADDARLLRIHSKCDLDRGEGLNVSVKTGEGLDELKRAVIARLERKAADGDASDLSGDVAALQETLALLRARPAAPDLVLLANAVRRAAERLGACLGAAYSADLLDNLFSRFCVGK